MRASRGTARAPATQLRPLPRALLSAFLASAATNVHAGPTGPAISAGSGAVTQAGSVTTIQQSSPRLSINWRSFSIGGGEAVVFQQPSAQAIALNRVLGQDPSVILGTLTANGQVFLLNPNGVLFGAGARVDVGGIVASTLSLSDADFAAGRYTFSGNRGNGSVVNRGTIRAADGGYVALVGPKVSNEGQISARLGTVALGAGEQVTLKLDGQQLVGFSVDKAAVEALAANQQLIQADGGSVILSAQAKDALLSTVVNNTGIVEARSVSVKNGVIRLEGGAKGVVSVGGKLDASGTNPGEHGGQVQVIGDKVALMDGALVDASGRSGGGKVLVGGDYQGKNPVVQNASRTFVAPTATVRADATGAGDGGTVVVWADGDTRFHGTVSARGGSGGGNGGFVEVSGKQQLGFDGHVDTTAVTGAIGQLLLDPDDLYVSSGAVSGAQQEFANPFRAIDGVTNRYVLASTLTALSGNTAVILLANHDILLQTNLTMPTTAAGSISMTAANSIQMGGSNLSTSNGSVTMTAGAGGITGLGTINLGTGTLTLNSSGAITQNGSDSIQGATSLVKQGSGTLTLAQSNTYTGTTTISAGTVRLGAANRIANTSAITVASGATFDLNGFAETVGSIAGAGSVTLGAGKLTAGGDGTSTTFSGAISGTGGLTKTGAGVLTLSGTNTYTGTTTISAGTLRTSGGSAIADASAVALANAAGAVLDLATNETIGNLSGGGANGGNITLNGNTLTVNQTDSTTYSGVTSGTGGIAKQGTGNLTLGRANTYTGVTSVFAGTLTLGANNVLANGSSVAVNGGTLSVNTRTDTVAGVQLVSGSITGTTGVLTSTSAYDMQSGSVTAILAGAVGLNKSTAGTVTLSRADTYTGATNISAGTLVVANTAALGTTATGTAVANGATLQIAGVAIGAEALQLNGAGVGSGGALVGTGTASLGGAVTLASGTTIAATAAADTLALSGTVNGAQALTQAGAGTVTFGSAVGGSTPLGSFASNAGSATRINGGLLRTTGTQVYNGALTTGGATTLQTTSSNVAANASVNAAAGALTLTTGAGNVTMTNPANNFATVTIPSAGAVSLVDANALTLGASTLGTLQARTLGGNLNVSGAIAASGSGDSIVLATSANFVNNAGGAALNPGAGRWLVWSTNPASDTRGGLTYAFKQYNATYGSTPVTGTGNGFLYSLVPSVTPSLIGTVTKVYDGTTTAPVTSANYAVSGAIDGDTVNVGNPASATYDTKTVGTGKNVAVSGLTVVGATNGAAVVYGYQLTTSAANANIGMITPAPLTGGITAANKTYDATTAATITSRTLTGVLGGDSVSYVGGTATFANKDVGIGKAVTATGLSLSGTDAANYTVNSTATTTADIAALALVGSITATNKAYDGTTAATITSRTLGGTIPGDIVSYVGGVANFADKNVRVGKTVTASGLSLSGEDAGNYTVNTTATTTADITALALTGSITAANKAYDATTAATIATRTLSGVISGDSVSYVGGAAAFGDKNVGVDKLVVASGLGLAGADAGNYTVNIVATTTSDITALAIAGSITAADKVYDGTTSATITSRTLSGVIGADAVSYVGGTASFADRNVAAGKTVTATGLSLSGADAANYTVNTTATTTADITALALTGRVTAASKTYDGTTSATLTSRTLNGVIAGDAVSYVGGTATFSDKNVGVSKTVTATALSLTGADAGNYMVNSTATTTADITALALTGSITAATKTYDGTTSATITSRTLAGAIPGDIVSYVGGTANFADKNVGAGKTVTASGLGLAGADAGNYTVNGTATTTADIAALALTGSITAADKVYDGSDTATITSRTLSGVIAGDAVTYVGGMAAFSDKNVAVGKTVTATALSLFGTDAANYTVNTTATTTASITVRALSVTADPGQTKVYGDPDPLPFSYAVTSGSLVTGDSLSGALSRNTGENVGGYALLQNTLTAGPNYSLAFVSNLFTITPATLSYVATPVSIFQGTPLPPFSGTVSGFKAGDTLASATTGALAFTTTAPDSNSAGVFPIDGAGLSARFGNYVFVQAPPNATALIIAPSSSPSTPGTAANALAGSRATAAQIESGCADLYAGGTQDTLCGGQQNFRQTQQVGLVPGWRRVIELGIAPLTLEGSGIKLPAGVREQ